MCYKPCGISFRNRSNANQVSLLCCHWLLYWIETVLINYDMMSELLHLLVPCLEKLMLIAKHAIDIVKPKRAIKFQFLMVRKTTNFNLFGLFVSVCFKWDEI